MPQLIESSALLAGAIGGVNKRTPLNTKEDLAYQYGRWHKLNKGAVNASYCYFRENVKVLL